VLSKDLSSSRVELRSNLELGIVQGATTILSGSMQERIIVAEKRMRISVGAHSLEAAYESGAGRDTVVLCHPHPLYGGNMDNDVVMALKTSLTSRGLGTLRFNFRGVGSSGGSYGDGLGETEDLKGVIRHLRQVGTPSVHLAGYSFGAWITLRAIALEQPPASLCLVSPPMGFLDFSNLTLPSVPTLITLGDSDSFCSATALKEWIMAQEDGKADWHLEILDGCDHFYWGYEALLKSKVESFVSSWVAESAAENSDAPVR
jgi:uncharacterized protein